MVDTVADNEMNHNKDVDNVICADNLTLGRWLHTHVLALLLASESVGVAFTAAVPETGAAAVLHVVVPVDAVVAARSAVDGQAASSWGVTVTYELLSSGARSSH